MLACLAPPMSVLAITGVAMANALRMRRLCFSLLLLFASHSLAKISNLEMTALQQIGKALNYADSAFYSDPCSSAAIKCDPTNTTVIKLSFYGNGLSGIVPEALGSLKNLTDLRLGINNLVGPIPRGLGNLTLLTYVNLGTNNFNGSLPEGLGNLTKLTAFYVDNNQLTGPIPSSIGQLTKLQYFTAYHNHLNGTIPSQLGDCSSLIDLRIQENSFSGETSFLQGLKTLQYIDLSYNQFSGTIFKTLQGLTSLTKAYFRKNSFTDSPSSISNSLQDLDLAFNQITGSIPQNFGGSSLQNLFLDHNNLTKEVPDGSFSSMSSLQKLDLSHNLLNGSVAKFRAYLGNTEINYAFNYFTDASLKTFSCNISSPTSLDHCSPTVPGSLQGFAINAGGDNITFENLQFQPDLEHGFGFHYDSSGSRTWAVEISSYNSKIVSKPDLTDLAQIYRSMRSAEEYLAYHGSQLQPGKYNVTLYFAEIEGDQTGYRVFDVYIQGSLVRKDLDVYDLVGGNNNPCIIYNETEVTSGILSVQLIYNGKTSGSGAVSRGGPMISAISVILTKPYSNIPSTSSTRASKSSRKAIIIGCSIALFLILVSTGLLLLIFCLRRKNRHALLENEHQQKIGLMEYHYVTLRKATNNFNELSKIGKGGFGSVYKGVLPNGCIVAIKRLHGDRTAKQEEEFRKEIQLISMVRHQNLVDILGYCIYSYKSVQKFLLVSDYMPNGSLDKLLFSEDENYVLSWELRYKIALGTASGLAYLHDESKLHIIHCDIKPHNILLDEDFSPCLTDFGLARLFDDNKTHVTASKLQGTAGYLAPEYATKRQVSEKVDVYSFGVVLLQLLSGRHVIDTEQMVYLVDWAHELGPSNLETLMDKRLGSNYIWGQAKTSASVAILCTNAAASIRPRMRDARLMLEGIIQVPDLQFNSINEGASASGSQTASSLLSETRTDSQHSIPLIRSDD